MMDKNAKIYVAGHRGMVGSAIVRELQRQGYNNIITRTHKELDLCRQENVEKFFAEEKPEYVFLAAAKVGGIVANQTRVDRLVAGVVVHQEHAEVREIIHIQKLAQRAAVAPAGDALDAVDLRFHEAKVNNLPEVTCCLSAL